MQLIVGAGEVGSAIAEVLADAHEVTVRDLAPLELDRAVEAMHVCFPWSRRFVEEVAAYRDQYGPELIVVHSTVPVGTSAGLGAVHSPVIGRHPRLVESVRTFRKLFGGPRAPEAAELFERAGVRTECWPTASATEAGKLWSTLQHGLAVVMQKEAHLFAEVVGADPELVYRRFNQVYNEGFSALGEPFRLPIVRNVPGPIGGHCVIANARITPSLLARVLERFNDRYLEEQAGTEPVAAEG